MTCDGLAAQLLRDILSRVIFVRESSDPAEREGALEDLEYDLTAEIQRLEEIDAYRTAA